MKIKPVTILKHPKYPLMATAAVAAAGVSAWVVPPPEEEEICVKVWEASETVEREPITTMGIIAPYPRDKSSRKPVIEPRFPEGEAEPSAPPVPEVDTLPEPEEEICVEVREETVTVEREPITTMGIIAPYPRDKSSRKPVIEPRLPEDVAEPSAPPVPEVGTLPEPEAGAEEQEKSAAP